MKTMLDFAGCLAGSRPQQGGGREDKRYDETGGMLIVHVGYRGPGTVGHAPPCTEGPSS